MLELAWPWMLAALPLPLLVLWLAPPKRDVVPAVRFPFFEKASSGLGTGEGASVRRRTWWEVLFAWVLWTLLVVMLARPEWVGPPIERSEAARDVMLAVDISGSMQTRDFIGPDGTRGARLDGVKAVLDAFIADRRDDRIGVVVFGDAAYVLVPFTRDLSAARSLLASLQPGMAGQNTVLGDAIGLAIRSFRASEVETRILVLLSDGTDTGSRMAPEKAAAIAAQNGVVIHTVAVGDVDAASDRDKVDTAALQAIASATDGGFHRAEDAESLAAIYAEIDAAGAREGTTVAWRPRTSVAAIPAALAASFVLAAYLALLTASHLWRGRTGGQST